MGITINQGKSSSGIDQEASNKEEGEEVISSEEEDEVVGSGRIGLGDVVKQFGGDIRSFFGR